MRRRELITGLGSTALSSAVVGAPPWARVAYAQQGERVRRIAVLMGSAQTDLGTTYLATFRRRLETLGWVEGRNARFDVRWWTGGPEQMRPVIADMLAATPDVVMVFSNLALAVLKPMVGQVPVVFVGVGDPVGDGFVASLARPGGTITGFAGTDGPIGGKWLEVLKETVPQLARVMAILHPETLIHQSFWRSINEAAPRFGVEVVAGGVHNAAEIESAIASFAAKDAGIIVLPHAITWANENLLIALGLRYRLPSHYATADSVKAGGLVSYGHDFEDSFRKTAEYVDRVLRGDKPSDLPVQQPTKFKLAVNLKTARTIGLDISPVLLARADDVVE